MQASSAPQPIRPATGFAIGSATGAAVVKKAKQAIVKTMIAFNEYIAKVI